ncbi:MAG: lipase family protein [Candidatus Korobacteraceae bacterium]
MAVDVKAAFQYACCVKAAANIDPADLTSRAGQQTPPINGVTYDIVNSIYGNDLATDVCPENKDKIVSFGLVLQGPDGGVVIAIRGTNGVPEWIHDAEFRRVTCPILPGAGETDDGFTAVYLSLRVGADPASQTVVQALPGLKFPRAVTSLTICGHSLGGALVTLLALDVAAHTAYKTPFVYTYASPRTGDPQFVDTYNQVVTNSVRMANRLDLVPLLPLVDMGYAHVNTFFELHPGLDVDINAACRHFLTTYLYTLAKLAGVPGYPVDIGCKI